MDNYLAFLDVFPIAKGHTLVIPKKEIDNMFDLDDDLLGGLHIFAKKISKAIEKIVPCNRVGTAVVGLEVPMPTLPFFNTVMAFALAPLFAPMPISNNGSVETHESALPPPALYLPIAVEI